MSLCPNCRRLDAEPGSIHNRGRLVPARTRPGESWDDEARLYTCRDCGAVWQLSFTVRSPRVALPAERWSLRQVWRPQSA